MPKLGREYEQAVHSFVETLDPSAEVIFNHHVPDRDTGTLRQCDVWINAKYGGHWPLSILVSCKDHSRKLDVGDIGTFVNEVHSAGASTGVIYSRAGYTQPALKKAEANSINCCRIYINEPADTPAIIVIEQFCCTPRINLNLMADPTLLNIRTWGQLLDKPSSLSDNGLTILDEIANVYSEKEKHAVSTASGFPLIWYTDLDFRLRDNNCEVKISVLGNWRCFAARTEATYINGSYCVTGETFHGEQFGPFIDTYSAHPGEGWNEILDPAYSLPLNRTVIILRVVDVRERLKILMGHQELFPGH